MKVNKINFSKTQTVGNYYHFQSFIWNLLSVKPRTDRSAFLLNNIANVTVIVMVSYQASDVVFTVL